MARLVQATLEPCVHNTDGSSVTLYFKEEPTEAEILAALKANPELCLAGEDDDDSFEFDECPNALSRETGLRRYQVYLA